MKSHRILLFFILICCIAPSGCAGSPAGEPVVAELPAMDTLMKLTLYGENAQAAAEPAKERIRELEGLLSTTDENSEIYAANHSGGAPVALSGDTAALLDRALQLCRRTDGALDVTIYPVVRAWGFTTGGGRVPDRAELDGAVWLVE